MQDHSCVVRFRVHDHCKTEPLITPEQHLDETVTLRGFNGSPVSLPIAKSPSKLERSV